ncbi:MAG: GDSL-type esterase/lipase family protein [Lentisphaeria bacterium]|jgi:lysophospholipase L1-like esterase
MKTLLLAVALLLALGSWVPAHAEAVGFTEAQVKSNFIGDFQKWLARDGEMAKDKDAILCIGSSSLRLWQTIQEDLAPAKVIHCGFGGSTIGDVLLFKEFFRRYEARTILLYEGDNDLESGNFTPESFVAKTKEFCAAVWTRRPDTKFCLLSVKPSPARAKSLPRQQAANKLLQEFAAGNRNVIYVDLATPMLGRNGAPRPELFAKDRLHLNPAGYALWTRVVRAALKLDESPAPP